MRRYAFLAILLLAPPVIAQTTFTHSLPYVAGGTLTRIINLSDRAGDVRILGFDNAGERFGPVTLELDALATRQLTLHNLENGAPARGLPIGLGDGVGAWRLDLRTELDIRPLVYRRVGDTLVPMLGMVPAVQGVHHVLFFHAAGEPRRRSMLRLINPNDRRVHISIRGRDDAGTPAEEGVGLFLAAGASRMLSAELLEGGGTTRSLGASETAGDTGSSSSLPATRARRP